MRTACIGALLGALGLIGAPASAGTGDILLPSGIAAHLHEVIDEAGEGGPVARFRYVAEALDPAGTAPDVALEDMAFLCENNALPRVDGDGEGLTIIVSLADRAAPFGVMDGSVAQIFEVFSVKDDTCIWEAF